MAPVGRAAMPEELAELADAPAAEVLLVELEPVLEPEDVEVVIVLFATELAAEATELAADATEEAAEATEDTAGVKL